MIYIIGFFVFGLIVYMVMKTNKEELLFDTEYELHNLIQEVGNRDINSNIYKYALFLYGMKQEKEIKKIFIIENKNKKIILRGYKNRSEYIDINLDSLSNVKEEFVLRNKRSIIKKYKEMYINYIIYNHIKAEPKKILEELKVIKSNKIK